MAHDPSVKYSEEVTAAQLEELTARLSFSVRGGMDQIQWTCPRCKAQLRQSFSRDDPIYTFDVETVDVPKDQGVLDLICKCGFQHEGGEGKSGCGFAAHLPVKPS